MRCFLFFSFLLSIFSTSAQTPADTAAHRKLLEKGVLLARKMPDSALSLMNRAAEIAISMNNRTLLYGDYLQIAFCHCGSKKFDLADGVFEKLNGMADVFEKEPQLEAKAYLTKGNCLRLKNDLEGASNYYNKAINCRSATDQVKIKAKLNLSTALNAQKKYQKALSTLIEVEPVAQKTGEPLDRFLVYYNMAAIHEETGDFDSALKYYKKAMDVPDIQPENRCSALYQIGSQYNRANDPQALAYFQEIVQKKENAKRSTYLMTLSALLGWYTDHNLDSAALYLNLLDSEGPDTEDSDYLFKKGRYLVACERFSEGIPRMENALKNYREFENNDAEFGTGILAALVRARLAAIGNNDHVADFEALMDSISRQEKLRLDQEVQKWKVNFETNQVEAHNERLRGEQKRLWLSVALLAAFALGVGAFAVQTSRLAKLHEQNRLVAEQNAALLETQKAEILSINSELLAKLAEAEQGFVQNARKNWSDETITLNDGGKTQIRIADILFINAEMGGVYWNTPNARFFVWQSVKTCLQLLPKEVFAQISRSTVVNRMAIEARTAGTVVLKNGVELAVTDTFQQNLLD